MKNDKKQKKYSTGSLFTEAELKPTQLMEYSFLKESKQKEYISRIQLYDTLNKSTGSMDYCTEKEYKSRAQLTRQKVFTIEHLAKERGLTPIFITLTLPSRFHPFISKEDEMGGRYYHQINPSFMLCSMDEAIAKGYKVLNEIHKTFYKRIKYITNGNCLFVKVVEPHKTFVPHIHCLFFVPKDCVEDIYNSFKRMKEKYSLGRSELEPVKFKKNVRYASAYLLKYITKNLTKPSDVAQMRLLDGWRRKYRIRDFSCSQLPINTVIYKKLYSSSTKERKKKISSKKEYKIANVKEIVRRGACDNNISFYTYFLQNCYVEKHMFDENGCFIKQSTYGDISSEFKVLQRIERYRNSGGYSYKTLSLKITYKGVDIYVDKQFMKLTKGGI